MCEKIQNAIVSPSSVNLLSVEMTDFEITNPSLSSDDTLTTSSPILGEPSATASSSSREEVSATLLSLSCNDSTDDCESEDGLNSR